MSGSAAFRSESLAVGVYGGFRGTSGPTSGPGDDCFSVFHSLSAILGLAGSEPGSGLWGMNDAAGPLGVDGVDADLRGWFQVTPIADVSTPLPLEPLVCTAVAVLGRFGELSASGFEFHVPLSAVPVGSGTLLDAGAWFRMAHADAGCAARLTVESDTDEPVPTFDEFDRAVRDGGGRAAGFALVDMPNTSPVEFARAVPWRWWLGDPGSTRLTTFGVRLPEWSPVAAGRAALHASAACRALDMSVVGIRIAAS